MNLFRKTNGNNGENEIKGEKMAGNPSLIYHQELARPKGRHRTHQECRSMPEAYCHSLQELLYLDVEAAVSLLPIGSKSIITENGFTQQISLDSLTANIHSPIVALILAGALSEEPKSLQLLEYHTWQYGQRRQGEAKIPSPRPCGSLCFHLCACQTLWRWRFSTSFVVCRLEVTRLRM